MMLRNIWVDNSGDTSYAHKLCLLSLQHWICIVLRIFLQSGRKDQFSVQPTGRLGMGQHLRWSAHVPDHIRKSIGQGAQTCAAWRPWRVDRDCTLLEFSEGKFQTVQISLVFHGYYVITEKYIFNSGMQQHFLGPVPRAGRSGKFKELNSSEWYSNKNLPILSGSTCNTLYFP